MRRVTIEEPTVRGGVSFIAVLSGTFVALGAMAVIGAIIAAVVETTGVAQGVLGRTEAIQIGLGAGVALVIAQFVSYLWGGYTAGRMGRGAGLLNGILVPAFGIAIAALGGYLIVRFGQRVDLTLPYQRPSVENSLLLNYGVGLGLVMLASMFLGGITGGVLGARWHDRLEEEELGLVEEERATIRQAEPTGDVRVIGRRDGH